MLHKSQPAHGGVVMSTPHLGVTTDETLPLSFPPFINAGAPIVANASLVDLFVYDVPSFDVVISSASFAFSILGIVANLLEKYVFRHVPEKIIQN